MKAPRLLFTPGHGTVAAMPGGLEISEDAYVRYFGDSRRERVQRRLASRLPAWLGRIQPFRGCWGHWMQIRLVLREGCLNPAIVLDSTSGLTAVFTSLSVNADQPSPVIQVVAERLHLIRPAPPAKGTLLVAASVYWRHAASSPHADWDDVSSIVTDCLVEDPALRRATLDRIKPMAWKALHQALAQLEPTPKPGLYPVHLPSSLVRACW